MSGVDDGTTEEMQATILGAHNKLRAIHGAPQLQWDQNCANDAQVCANNCQKKGEMYHNTHEEQGQNVSLLLDVNLADHCPCRYIIAISPSLSNTQYR